VLNIVLPLAGRGRRFAQAGFTGPQPLIPVHGAPMIDVVVNNVRPSRPHRFIFVVEHEHLEHPGLRGTLEAAAPGCVVVAVDTATAGAARAILFAKHHIDSDDPLMLVTSDQWVDISIDDYLATMETPPAAGLIMTKTATDPGCAFVGLDEAGNVTSVVEHEPVSDEATVGIYNFRRGRDFVRAAEAMLANQRAGDESTIAPAYNELIAEGARISLYNVGSDGDGMYGLSTPADLDLFLDHPVSRRATMAARMAA
jgi:dTDP-glucose pyrophosphorylase